MSHPEAEDSPPTPIADEFDRWIETYNIETHLGGPSFAWLKATVKQVRVLEAKQERTGGEALKAKVEAFKEYLTDRKADYERMLSEKPPLPKKDEKTVGSWLNELEHIIRDFDRIAEISRQSQEERKAE